jgi:hypothetical protein
MLRAWKVVAVGHCAQMDRRPAASILPETARTELVDPVSRLTVLRGREG